MPGRRSVTPGIRPYARCHMIHGQEIDAIEFYLTNQDQQIQDLQGSNFAATLRVSSGLRRVVMCTTCRCATTE
eukprot:COSAG02_NODE_25069_length_669_cov_2.966667_2_plen_72_part_01